MSGQAYSELILTLGNRFASNMHRHPGMDWENVRARLLANPGKLRSISEMERTGGEPDVVALDGLPDTLNFIDCSPESPTGRRSLCFDQKALDARKENKPAGSALELSASMGVELLTETQYCALQTLEPFDRKTSSWIQTPHAIRALGGALFCDRRYDTVFVYHNGADSYYAARGFRARLAVSSI
jgi:hypothetical protein